MRPQLFARYLPGVLPTASSIEQLDAYRDEALRMQRDLLANPAFIAHGDATRKRSFDEYNAVDSQLQPSAPCTSGAVPVVAPEAQLRLVAVSPDGLLREQNSAVTSFEPPRRIRVQDTDEAATAPVQNWSAVVAVADLTLTRPEQSRQSQPDVDADADMIDGLNNNGND